MFPMSSIFITIGVKIEKLTKLYKVAEKNNIQANIIKFYYENIDGNWRL